jgi:hypothetical protein
MLDSPQLPSDITGRSVKKVAQAVRLIFRNNCDLTRAQLTQRLEETARVSMKICPLLSLATLSAISGGKLRKRRERSFSLRVPTAVLGCSTQDLGEEFISSNFRFL